jgi:predicted enzyme related to lactoylglutathione lyase
VAQPVAWFEIVGKDSEKLSRFYGDLFGWKIDLNNPMKYGQVEAADGGIAGGIGQTEDGPGHVTIYIAVDDPQEYLDKAERLGGKTVMPVTEIPNMVTFAQFEDPEGHLIGLFKSRS